MAQFYTPVGTQLTQLPSAPTLTLNAGGALTNGVYTYAVSFLTNAGESLVGNLATETSAAGNKQITLTAISLGPSYCLGRKIYRSAADGAVLKLRTTIYDNTTTSFIDAAADSTLGTNYSIASDTIDSSLNVNGTLNVNGFLRQTVASLTIAAGASGICNGSGNSILVTGLTTAANAVSSQIILNNFVTASSMISATIINYTGTFGTNGVPSVAINSIGVGTFTLVIQNGGGAALANNLQVFCQIIN